MLTLLTTPPVAPQTLAALQSLGIRSIEELRDTGSVQAFLLLKAAGLTVTRSTLWQLEALLLGIKPQELPQTQKTALEQAVKNHQPVAVFPTSSEMETFMRAALVQAEQSARIGEIPVGAVIVFNNQIIAAAHNTCVSDHDISRHAEIRALATAGTTLKTTASTAATSTSRSNPAPCAPPPSSKPASAASSMARQNPKPARQAA